VGPGEIEQWADTVPFDEAQERLYNKPKGHIDA
jgi:hypothetical protein